MKLVWQLHLLGREWLGITIKAEPAQPPRPTPPPTDELPPKGAVGAGSTCGTERAWQPAVRQKIGFTNQERNDHGS